MIRFAALVLTALLLGGNLSADAEAGAPLKVGVFSVDASPPVGSPMAYDRTKGVAHPLSLKGVVLIGEGDPVVLCAIDWIGVANGGQTEFRSAIAKAAQTRPDRVSVNALHQHDAPLCDFSLDAVLAKQGINEEVLDARFAREVIQRAAEVVRKAKAEAKVVTHLGLGQAEVDRVASNRRLLGADGKVQYVRYTACADSKLRAMPAGTIDPMLKMVSFWNGDQPIAVLTYYATHPQSYYRTALANPDFPGIARDGREKATGIPHIHFDGAGGNIGAGKWNDGSPENRQVLADRVADGMKRALEATKKSPILAKDLDWSVVSVALPPAPHLIEEKLVATLENTALKPNARAEAASQLIWLRRCKSGEKIDLGCLRLGSARILHMPGELFVEYQLAAQKLRPDLFVAMAAYGEYAPGYIGTEISYGEGGYETSPGASWVAPSVEKILMKGIDQLLVK